MKTLFLALLLSGFAGFAVAQDAPAFEEPPAAEEEAPKPKKKAKKAKKEKPSKYKFTGLDEGGNNYRFDADGNPIKSKKKKAKKPVSTPDDEIDGIVPAEDCTLQSDTCGEKKPTE